MGNLLETTENVRLRQYAEMVLECKGSGMTVAKWCEENGIAKKTYYYRQNRARKALLEMGVDGPVPPPAGMAEFAKVPDDAMPCAGPATAISVNGIRVDVYEGAGAGTIKAGLEAAMGICSGI